MVEQNPPDRRPPDRRPPRPGPAIRLEFGAGGWVLGLSVLLVSAILLWRISDMLRSRGERALGDGIHPETYGFDLHNCEVPRELLIGSGLPRDGLPVLDLPPLWGRATVDSLARAGRNKYLVSSDRVIGVVIGGRPRAYPLLVLNWHEVVNDTLGGLPIAVTYNPLCDAAVVHDRRVSLAEDRSSGASPPNDSNVPSNLLFGHSGILYNSDLLLYDRGAGRGRESLWIQLTGEAISGPAKDAGLRLSPIPCQLVHWSDWKEAHPETTVPARDPARKDRYRREPYVSYFGNDLPRFPVSPRPPRERMPWKTPCVILEVPERFADAGVEEDASDPSVVAVDQAADARNPSAAAFDGAADARDRAVEPGVFPLPLIAARTGADGAWRTEWRGFPVTFRYRDRPAAAWVEEGPPALGIEPPRLVIRHAFWFAWYAMNRGEVELPETAAGG